MPSSKYKNQKGVTVGNFKEIAVTIPGNQKLKDAFSTYVDQYLILLKDKSKTKDLNTMKNLNNFGGNIAKALGTEASNIQSLIFFNKQVNKKS